MPQDLGLRTEASLAEVLGIAETWEALERITAGQSDPELFERVGEDWDIEERARQALARADLPPMDLRRTVGELSGGQAVRAALAGIRLARPQALILDEPTNSLDAAGRAALTGLLEELRQRIPVLVVSHDRALLERCETISGLVPAEFTRGHRAVAASLRQIDGPYSAWEETCADRERTARRRVREAEAEVGRETRERAALQTRRDHDARRGRRAAQEARYAPLVAGNRKRAAQRTAAQRSAVQADREQAARKRLARAEEQLSVTPTVHVDLPETAVPASARILELRLSEEARRRFDARTAGGAGAGVGADEATSEAPRAAPLPTDVERVLVVGPERVRLAGANGSGKSTLIRRILAHPAGSGAPVSPAEDAAPPGPYEVLFRAQPVGHLPQRILLDPWRTVLETVAEADPGASEQRIRDRLAALLFRRESVFARVGELSGGERLRVALARELLAARAPRLLILDEPTNDLDLPTVDWLVQALSAYRGALLLVTHDEDFAARVGIQRTVDLDAVLP